MLVCLVSYLQLRWIHQQIQGFFYRCLQVLLVSGDGILFYRFSNQFYRLQQESLRAWILTYINNCAGMVHTICPHAGDCLFVRKKKGL